MEKIKYIWEDIKYYVEDHGWVKWLTGGVVALAVVFIGIGLVGGEDGGASKGEVTESTAEEESGNTSTTEEGNAEVPIGVSEETVHILTNPDQYAEEDINRAYHDSLTTFDNQFVEDNTYVDTGLANGVYLYHEKADDEYVEISQLAQDVSKLGVPVYFYTPQFDQSIASLSNHTQVVENGEVVVKAVIVRDYKVAEEITELEEVKTYMEGVLDENTK